MVGELFGVAVVNLEANLRSAIDGTQQQFQLVAVIQFFLREKEREAGLGVLAPGFGQRLTTQQEGAVNRMGRAECGRHQVGSGFRFAGVACTPAQRVACIKADRLGHLDNQNAIPQSGLAHEERVLSGLLRPGHGIGLERAECARVGLQDAGVLLTGNQQHAQWCITGHLVTLENHRGWRHGHAVHRSAQGINQIRIHHIGRCNGDFIARCLHRLNTGAGRDKVAVLRWSLHRIDANLGKIRVRCQRQCPFDVVVEPTGTGQMRQNQLIAQAVHVVLAKGAGQLAQLVRRALLRHGVTRRNWVARLVDAQPILAERHGTTQALGIATAHDGFAAKRINQVKRNLVACCLLQVHAANNRHFVARLVADGALGVRLLG